MYIKSIVLFFNFMVWLYWEYHDLWFFFRKMPRLDPRTTREDDENYRHPENWQQLLLQRTISPISWEENLANSITLEDLDAQEIIRTVKEGIRTKRINAIANSDNIQEVLDRLELTSNGKLTNAAVVLFCKEIPGSYFQCVLRLTRFKGTEKGSFIDSNHIFGNVFRLLEEAETFINRNTSIASRFEDRSFQRIDEPEYPHMAIRKAVINALCHREYTASGGSITIAIYDDRIEITSTGTLPNGITTQDLKQSHSSNPRNRRITNVFFRRGLIEAFGIGTQEIIQSCKQANMREPDFYEQAGAFVVRLWSKHYQTMEIENLNITKRQKEILGILMQSKMSPSDILSQLTQKITDRTLRSDLQTLKSMNLIDNEGKGPNTKWFSLRSGNNPEIRK